VQSVSVEGNKSTSIGVSPAAAPRVARVPGLASIAARWLRMLAEMPPLERAAMVLALRALG